jgi:GABA(A) receptor-associated protein
MKFKYQEDCSFERRREEAANIRTKYPDRVPVIVERRPGSDMPLLDNNKFLVPNEVTVGQLMWLIRRRMKLSADRAFFMYISAVIPSSSAMVSEMYDEYKDADGFLYISYSGENTYGHERH